MNDFVKDYLHVKKDVDRAVNKVLTSGWYILGRSVVEFEKQFAHYTGRKYCIGVANGMEALQISLIALGVGRGDDVITVSNTAVATALAITAVGAKPVFVDIDDYFHLDPSKLEKAITKKTKAIIPVHLFGQMTDMPAILKIAKKYNLSVVEDACQAHGASLMGKMAGSFGAIGCFSFYPTKNLGAYGDGGAIVTDNKKLYEASMMIRNYGQTNRYEHKVLGLNSRLDELQAAILSEKLKKMHFYIKKRNEIADVYRASLKDIREVVLPMVRPNSIHAYHLFVIQAQNRNKLQSYLAENGVESLIHYPIPIHKQECYKGYDNRRLSQTEYCAKNILSLPIHPFLETDEVKSVCNLIKNFYT